jgi:ABC-type Fe3+ transport system substrate-binding protein
MSELGGRYRDRTRFADRTAQNLRLRRAAIPALALMAHLMLTPSAAGAAGNELYEAARAEGQVVWYTTLIINVGVRPLIAAFEQKYPGVTVRYSRTDSGPTATKVLNEARAGKVQADIVDGTDSLPPLQRAGLLAKYVPAAADRYPPELKDPDAYWSAVLVYFMTPAFNTRLVPRNEAPKKLEDLLDPKWKGKIAWTTSRGSGGPTFIGGVLQQLGEEKGMHYLDALSKQEIINVNVSARALVEQCGAGQYPIVLQIFNHHAAMDREKGVPVDWIKLDLISAPMQVAGLLKDAPHPSAGRLFMDFLTSEEGQTILAKADLLPAMPGITVSYPEVKPEVAGFTPIILSQDLLARNIERWVQVYKDLFQ